MVGNKARTYRWLPADGMRHAVPGGRITPGEQITTLIDEIVTVPTQRLGADEWAWPTCAGCWDAAKDCTHVSLASLGTRSVANAKAPTATFRRSDPSADSTDKSGTA